MRLLIPIALFIDGLNIRYLGLGTAISATICVSLGFYYCIAFCRDNIGEHMKYENQITTLILISGYAYGIFLALCLVNIGVIGQIQSLLNNA